ncbi:hypothetical protein ACIP5Y_25285 [Nocardia sp. NPDC088792]|uniref:hypothetical protein n=1 Tax=Nocardia sp. NPDC088792 TaxID=3364332 RepID=UPI0038057E40
MDLVKRRNALAPHFPHSPRGSCRAYGGTLAAQGDDDAELVGVTIAEPLIDSTEIGMMGVIGRPAAWPRPNSLVSGAGSVRLPACKPLLHRIVGARIGYSVANEISIKGSSDEPD